MKSTVLRCVYAALFTFCSAVYADSWIQVEVPDLPPEGEPYHVTFGSVDRDIKPKCALSDYSGERYSFYIKPGKSDRVFVYFNGGGACWNGATCYPYSGVYVPTTAAGNNPNQMGGIFDAENPANPYKDWTMVFLPYCTGDVFLAAKETVYPNPYFGNPDPYPLSPDFPAPFINIQHRGYDNFLYVMNYIRQSREGLAPPNKLLVTGSSAGSYGAAINFPVVKEALGVADNTKAKSFLLGDGGHGVLDSLILDHALFGVWSSWNVDANLHPVLSDLGDVTEGVNLMPTVYGLLSTNNTKDKFAQYTTAYDAIQTVFWNIMMNESDPTAWFNFAGWIGPWNSEMNAISTELSSLPNYRYYIDSGCNHTIFRYSEFYSSTVERTSFVDWMTGMTIETTAHKNDWQNFSCTPGIDCGEDSLTQAGIQQCLDRSFGVPQ